MTSSHHVAFLGDSASANAELYTLSLHDALPISPRIRRALARHPVPGEFGERLVDVLGDAPGTLRTSLEVEQRRPGVAFRDVGSQGRVPRLCGPDRARLPHQLRVPEDPMDQPQVVAALDGHAGGQQTWIPGRRVAAG